jgi:hypothetical protein
MQNITPLQRTINQKSNPGDRMFKALHALPTRIPTGDDCPALKNLAVARCAQAWDKTYRLARAAGRTEYGAGEQAGLAFRQAMPLLSGRHDIGDFLACVTFGMLIEAISEAYGSRLIYLVRIALTTMPKQAKEPASGQPDPALASPKLPDSSQMIENK